MKNKVSVIGAGRVGATAAQYIAEDELADVVMVDIVEGLPQGKSLDLLEAGPIRGFDSILSGSNDYKDTANSDIVVIAAGLARKPGMSREELLMKNSEIIKSITDKVVKESPNCIIIVVSNPLDVMTYLCWKLSGFSPKRVLGMAGTLDSARFRAFVAKELNVSVKDTQALVLGGHGDSMVPLPRYCTVCGIPITELIPKKRIDSIVERTRKAGGEIVDYLKTGSAYYSPGACAAEMVEVILKDKKRLLPCAAYLNGEYGLKDVYVGVPVILGASGAERIVEVDLTKEEKNALHASAEIVKKNIAKLGECV
ncbi:MAG: malate dehydrogenase [Candidatus Omnitrophota bacterium]|nr:MAG: malate dehydrogenase [Candidatus Omnitrophota bacterium]